MPLSARRMRGRAHTEIDPGSEIDVNIHVGRAYIRLERYPGRTTKLDGGSAVRDGQVLQEDIEGWDDRAHVRRLLAAWGGVDNTNSPSSIQEFSSVLPPQTRESSGSGALEIQLGNATTGVRPMRSFNLRLLRWLSILPLLGLTANLRADIPKGELTKHTFEQSKIFPGTVRDYWIYVPKQYDRTKPACLYVCQDGVQYKRPQVFDELIRQERDAGSDRRVRDAGTGQGPLRPGTRSVQSQLEYDGLGNAYVRFLLDELLPEVEKRKTTADGRADPALARRKRPLHRRCQQRRHLPRSRRRGSGPTPFGASSARSAPMSACAAETSIPP